MIKRIAAVLAGAALAGGAALAQAQQDTTGAGLGSPSASSDLWRDTGKGGSGLETSSGSATGVKEDKGAKEGTGGSGTASTTTATHGSGTLQGTVVKAQGNDLLYVEHMGAIVPVQVNKGTTLLGLEGKKLTDLKDGEKVSISFQVKNRTQNVATTVQLLTGTGGSGFDNGLRGGEQGRDLGTGGSGSAGTSATGEDSSVGKTSVPDRDPLSHPRDVANPPPTTDEKPIY